MVTGDNHGSTLAKKKIALLRLNNGIRIDREAGPLPLLNFLNQKWKVNMFSLWQLETENSFFWGIYLFFSTMVKRFKSENLLMIIQWLILKFVYSINWTITIYPLELLLNMVSKTKFSWLLVDQQHQLLWCSAWPHWRVDWKDGRHIGEKRLRCCSNTSVMTLVFRQWCYVEVMKRLAKYTTRSLPHQHTTGQSRNPWNLWLQIITPSLWCWKSVGGIIWTDHQFCFLA